MDHVLTMNSAVHHPGGYNGLAESRSRRCCEERVRHQSRSSRPQAWLFLILTVCVVASTAAPSPLNPRDMDLPEAIGHTETQHLVNVELALDTRGLGSIEERSTFDRRQSTNNAPADEDSSSTSTSSASSASSSGSSSASTASATGASDASSASNATSTGPLSMPTPLDSGFGANISQSCKKFINDFLARDDFKSCLPLSLLLQNSQSFFRASKSLVSITSVLDKSCGADSQTCSSLLSGLTTDFQRSANCGPDLSDSNAVASSVLAGLRAYDVVYAATCLKSSSSSAYCYAEAITNSSNPSGSYLYYLPLGTKLPGGSRPACTGCTQQTMDILDAATSRRSSAIASTYVDAASQVNMQCGPGFVNTTLAPAQDSGAASYRRGTTTVLGQSGLVALVLFLGVWLL